MKKLMIAASAVCLIGMGMTSCKKSYECDCVTGISFDTTQVTSKGKDAVDACNKEDKILQLKDCFPA